MLRRLSWSDVDTGGKAEIIRSVYVPGMSASQIAARIDGASRNAVIGFYSRHKDKLLGDAPLQGSGSNHLVMRAPGTVVKRRRKVDLRTSKPIPEREWTSAERAIVGRPLWMIGARQCRYAVNKAEPGETHLMCGEAADGSWCEFHRRLVYQPRKKMNATDPALAS